MSVLTILVHRCNNPEPAYKLADGEAGGELNVEKAVILEQGMVSGKPSISFCLRAADGKLYIAQLSEDMLKNVISAVSGAKMYWTENPVENIWKK